MVVRGGQIILDIGLSSKPAIEISSGTDRPLRKAAIAKPAAISSLLAKIADGGDASLKNCSPASSPALNV